MSSVLALIGAVLQIALLIFKEWSETNKNKKTAIKELKNDFKEAVKARDYARLSILWDRANRLR